MAASRAAQRTLYELVLQAQLAAIAVAQPGNRYEAMHEAARRVLTEGLVALGLLPRGVEESLAMHHDREFYMHGRGTGSAWTCTMSGTIASTVTHAGWSRGWC